MQEEILSSIDTIRKRLEELPEEELTEIAEMAEELEQRDAMEAAQYYTPNGKVEKFIKLVGSDSKFVNMFIGANGVGKTAVGSNIVANIIFGPQNKWFKHPLFQQFPYIKRGRVISDPTTIKEKIIPELIKWLPRNTYKNFPEKLYETSKEGKYYASKFIFNNGWTIDVMSNEQDLKSFESVDLGFLWIDEPLPKDRFLASLARGRMGMICFWTYTPLFQAGWVKDWMDEHPDEAEYVEAEVEDACLADNAEILTYQGWRDLDKVQIGDIVATYNLKNRLIEYQKVNELVKKNFSGELISTGDGLLFTPDHRMVTFNSDLGEKRTIKNMPLEIRRADTLRRGVRMLNFSENGYVATRFDSPFPDKISGKDWCEFLGWYISEGCATGTKGSTQKHYGIYITQKHIEKRKKLKELLDKTKWAWRERKYEYWLSSKELHQNLFSLGNSAQKHIPRYVFEYPKEYLQLLWETLLITDGDSKKRYLTSSKQLADDVQELLIRLGYRASLRKWKQGERFIMGRKYFCADMYCVSALKHRYSYVDRGIKKVFYNGIVSCVSVDNETIIVRDKTEKYPLITGNCKIHGVRGILDHKAIQRMSDSMPEDEKEARIFGKFGHLLGRVHKRFNRKIHVIKPFPINEKDWTTYKALDPHPRVQDHVLYLSVNSKGTKIVTAELLSEGLVKMLNSRMIELETKMHFRIEDRIIDPSAFNDNQHTKEPSVGSQIVDISRERWIKGSKDLMAGIKRLEDAFDYEIKAGKFVKEPEIFIFDSCPVTIKQLEEYVWAEYKGTSADDKQKSGRPKDKNDHMPENLHRLILHEPKHIPFQLRERNNAPSGSSGASDIANNNFDPY